MKRTKPPARTSPWKVGFLVALMLVMVSIGVGYFMTRTFGLSWGWIEFTGGSWTAWQFDLDRFLVEMAPLVALVALTSIATFMMVAGAVRRYTKSAPSGSDYRQLVKSLKKIDDLNQRDRIKRLSNYPELRDFLLKIGDSVAEREKSLEHREAELVATQSSADTGGDLSEQSATLVEAIVNARTGAFDNDLDLSASPLKEIESAIRNHLLSAVDSAPAAADGDEVMGEVRAALDKARSEFSKAWSDVASEIDSVETTSREIETQLAALQNTVTSSSQGSGEEDATETGSALDDVRLVTSTLRGLSEETKSIAINAALKAGSEEGGGEAMIKLADDVRDVAAKFNEVADRGVAACTQVESSFGGAQAGGSADVGQAIGAVLSTVRLWVERMIVLHDRLNTLREYQSGCVTRMMGQLNPDEAHSMPVEPLQPEAENDSGGELEIESTTMAGAVDSAPTDVVTGVGEGFERTGSMDLFDSEADADVAVATDSGEAGTANDDSMIDSSSQEIDDYFDSIPDGNESTGSKDDDTTPTPEAPEENDADDSIGVVLPFTEDKSSDDDEANFSMLGPGDDAGTDGDETSDAVDLYELGAVDFEPEKHTV